MSKRKQKILKKTAVHVVNNIQKRTQDSIHTISNIQSASDDVIKVNITSGELTQRIKDLGIRRKKIAPGVYVVHRRKGMSPLVNSSIPIDEKIIQKTSKRGSALQHPAVRVIKSND